MEESPRPHRSSSYAFPPQASLTLSLSLAPISLPLSLSPRDFSISFSPFVVPRAFPQPPHPLVSLSSPRPSLLLNVRPLSLRLCSPLTSSPLPRSSSLAAAPPCQPREEIHFREKKGKKARKIDGRRRLAARGHARAGIGPRCARGRSLKMSSRCVIAYIDPALFAVCVRGRPPTLHSRRGTSRDARDRPCASRERRVS